MKKGMYIKLLFLYYYYRLHSIYLSFVSIIFYFFNQSLILQLSSISSLCVPALLVKLFLLVHLYKDVEDEEQQQRYRKEVSLFIARFNFQRRIHLAEWYDQILKTR